MLLGTTTICVTFVDFDVIYKHADAVFAIKFFLAVLELFEHYELYISDASSFIYCDLFKDQTYFWFRNVVIFI